MSDGVSASMFKKLKDFLIGRKAGDITPAEAHKIQYASYALAHTEVKKRFSPSYESMVSGLDSEEKQIFEGTAWYLAKIAENKPKYQRAIVEILEAKIVEKGINPEFREYLKLQVQNILSKNNL